MYLEGGKRMQPSGAAVCACGRGVHVWVGNIIKGVSVRHAAQWPGAACGMWSPGA